MLDEDQLDQKENSQLPVNLGDGLLMRWGVPADAEELGTFNVAVHSDNPKEPQAWLAEWTADLMSGRHPTTKASDFTLVIDRNEGHKIVSSLNLISQTWTYDGIPFGVGRIELVGTDPQYRRRGLIRKQMAVVHAKSAARGELVQAITGNPWFYRQFDYEMTLNLSGSRELFWIRDENDKAQDEEIFRMRPAEKSDIPILHELYVRHCADSLVVLQRDEEIWEYGLFIATRGTAAARPVTMIEGPHGEIVAYVQTFPHGAAFRVRELGVKEGHSWRAVALFLIRKLKKQADELNQGIAKPITHISFNLGETHPIYDALGRQLEKIIRPYTWYIRVADLPQFLQHIAPVLERRLGKSAMAGYSGALRLNFYRSNLTLHFERGILNEIGSYEPANFFDFDAAFPDLTFLHLLFGYRSMAEMDIAFADCFAANAEAAVLLDSLFPKRPSDINPLD